jgi:hypothetical protein
MVKTIFFVSIIKWKKYIKNKNLIKSILWYINVVLIDWY